MSRGHDRERDVRQFLTERGWVCVRAAGSLGPVDVVAMARGPHWPIRHPDSMRIADIPELAFIEVKSTAGGPYERFSPNDRQLMLNVSRKAGAEPWLCWWPPCKPGERKDAIIKWIPGNQWPNFATMVGELRRLPAAPPGEISSADVQGAIRPDMRGDRRARVRRR